MPYRIEHDLLVSARLDDASFWQLLQAYAQEAFGVTAEDLGLEVDMVVEERRQDPDLRSHELVDMLAEEYDLTRIEPRLGY